MLRVGFNALGKSIQAHAELLAFGFLCAEQCFLVSHAAHCFGSDVGGVRHRPVIEPRGDAEVAAARNEVTLSACQKVPALFVLRDLSAVEFDFISRRRSDRLAGKGIVRIVAACGERVFQVRKINEILLVWLRVFDCQLQAVGIL